MIIGVSGKIGSGKDTIGKIIQYLTTHPNSKNKTGGDDRSYNSFLMDVGMGSNPDWKIKKFADKLKDIVCLLINCTREELENQEFKNTPLGEEWWYYKRDRGYIGPQLLTQEEWNNLLSNQKGYFELIKLTPRLLLQFIGTECGRQIIHPNIWINSLFADYKSKYADKDGFTTYPENESGINWIIKDHPIWEPSHFPNWVITDMRFPNELQAIKDREGITIRVNRDFDQQRRDKGIIVPKHLLTPEHPSENSLDNAEFDYIIENDSDIPSLIEKVKEILIKEKII